MRHIIGTLTFALLLDSIAGSVVILPRLVPMLHDKEHSNVTSAFPPPVYWDAPLVLAMLAKFTAATRVATVPSLQEYAVLPDKVALHEMYRAYHAEVRAATLEHWLPF